MSEITATQIVLGSIYYQIGLIDPKRWWNEIYWDTEKYICWCLYKALINP